MPAISDAGMSATPMHCNPAPPILQMDPRCLMDWEMITALIEGMKIAPKMVLTNFTMRPWKYGPECCDIFTSIAAGTPLKIEKISRMPGDTWVSASLPGIFPPKCLKISADEYNRWFSPA